MDPPRVMSDLRETLSGTDFEPELLNAFHQKLRDSPEEAALLRG